MASIFKITAGAAVVATALYAAAGYLAVPTLVKSSSPTRSASSSDAA